MMSWPHSAELAGALAGAGIGLRAVRARWAGTASALAVEACFVAVLYTVWQIAGGLSLGGAAGAIRRAAGIERFEHAVRLPSERGLQHLVLDHGWLVQAANLYYASMHFAIIFVFLLWLFFRHRQRYGAVRTTLAISTFACLAIEFVPVAPPRMMPGFVDTALRYGQSVYGGGIDADQLSAMPSVHVLWAVIVGWYAVRIGKSRWRYLAPVHTVLTILVVVATGNHWWLDGIVAVAVLVACAWIRAGAVAAWRAARPAGTATAPAAVVPVMAAPVMAEPAEAGTGAEIGTPAEAPAGTVAAAPGAVANDITIV